MKAKKKDLYRFDVITLFPKECSVYIGASVLGRARKNGLISVKFHNPRDFSTDRHKTVDGRPFGGGPGMVMMAEPILKAIDSLKLSLRSKKTKIILLSARGKLFTGQEAERLALECDRIVLIAGRYEGVDERVLSSVAHEQFSIGDFILTGGELPALAIVDAVSRFIPGVLGKFDSLESRKGMYPVYTRPRSLKYRRKTYKVPEVLFSGHEEKIRQWREENGRSVYGADFDRGLSRG